MEGKEEKEKDEEGEEIVEKVQREDCKPLHDQDERG